MDNRDLRVVEFDICDLETKGQHVPDGSGLISPVESAHDSLVFTVVETVVHSEPIGTLVDLVTFKRLDELHRIIWHDCTGKATCTIINYTKNKVVLTTHLDL
jgi:hypothetical protein